MVKHMASKNKRPVSLRYVSSLITSQVLCGNALGLRLGPGWEQRAAAPFPHPHHVVLISSVGHGPPFPPPSVIPPSTRLRLRTVLVISFHRASMGALTNQLPASCWLALMEATTSPWFGGGENHNVSVCWYSFTFDHFQNKNTKTT